MSTHYIEEAQRLADTVMIMSHGTAVASGTPSELVLEHAGREVLEVYGPPARLAEVEAEAGSAGLRTRRTGTSVSVLDVDGFRGFDGVRRAANLEDVFVLLTGEEIAQMAAAAKAPRIGRLERRALTGVLVREVVNYSSYWKSSTFSSTVEPTIYLLAFGFGFGSLVSTINGVDYVDFVGTGTVATAVLFSSAFPGMFGTFVKYQFQRTYDAILAAPVDTEELVSAEAIWIATRAGVYGCVPMIVAMFFGLDPAWGMLAVPFIAWIAGFGWANFGISIAGFSKSFENFNYVVSAVLTPLFLLAGSFFPLDGFPDWLQALAQLQPALPSRPAPARRRALRLGRLGRRRHLGFLVGFGILMWRIAILAMTRKLVD